MRHNGKTLGVRPWTLPQRSAIEPPSNLMAYCPLKTVSLVRKKGKILLAFIQRIFLSKPQRNHYICQKRILKARLTEEHERESDRKTENFG